MQYKWKTSRPKPETAFQKGVINQQMWYVGSLELSGTWSTGVMG